MITSEESLMSVDGSSISSPYKTEKEDKNESDKKLTNYVQKAAADFVNWIDLLSDVESDEFEEDEAAAKEDKDDQESSNILQSTTTTPNPDEISTTQELSNKVKLEAATISSTEEEEMKVSDKEPKIKVQDFEEDNAREGCSRNIKTEINLTSFAGTIKKEREIEIDILDAANLAKYERLVKTEKLKSPFKRRLSENSEKSTSSDAIDNKKSKLESGRRNSTNSSESSGTRGPREYETNKDLLARRQKQIDFGKNTLGYDNYLTQIPKIERLPDHPRTPPKHMKYSRRAWDGIIKIWRKKLHCWDPQNVPTAGGDDDLADIEEQ